MGNILKGMEPYKVFKYFEEISQIPRGSKNEKAVSDYLVNFAKKSNYEYIEDSELNVIIKKPASPGYENAPTVILQGHMDMVCEKNKDTVHDFEKDPLKLRIAGDMIYATGTTLGADNGIAVAYNLALLDSNDIAHPELEVVFTSDEENGMGGVVALDPKHLKGRILINIDHEVEGQLLVSCAGGINSEMTIPIVWDRVQEGKVPIMLRIRGLKGGHSGISINKGRGNANKLMGRFLIELNSSVDFEIAELNGGIKNNAIPRECEALILVNEDKIKLITEKADEWSEKFKNELLASDSNVRIEASEHGEKVDRVFSKDTSDRVIKLLNLVPDGINTMSAAIEGLVESSNNIGVITTKEAEITFYNVARSCVKSLKTLIVNEQRWLSEIFSAEYTTSFDYPEWQYDPNSKLRMLFEKVYVEVYGKTPEIAAVHAGIECGIFKEKFGEMDMISFGPNIYDVHTPDEHVSISSVQRSWKFLLEILKELK